MASILLVERDDVLRDALHNLLENKGHQVISVKSAYQADVVLHESKIDSMLLDVDFPIKDEIGFVVKVITNHANVDVHLLLHEKGLKIEAMVRLLDQPKVSMISKPLTAEKLSAAFN